MRRLRSPAWCWAALAAVLLLQPRASGRTDRLRAAKATPPGVILVVEGIGGIRLMQVAGDVGFHAAGLPYEVRQFRWSHGTGRFLKDLQDFRNVLAKGDELAAEVLAIKRKDPERRVFIVAHSGGTGIAARAAELLPPNCLERMVFLSSALSPDYDLRPSLAASRRGIVSYHSAHDFLILGLGTKKFGTIDRAYGPSAGYAGFRVPRDLTAEDRALYAKLVQVPWNPYMVCQGNLGTHNGTVFPGFLATEVAKWLR